MRSLIFLHHFILVVSVLFVAAPGYAENLLEVTKRGNGSGVELIAQNPTLADITVVMEVTGSNIKTSPQVPLTVVVPAKSKDFVIVKVIPKSVGKQWRYKYDYQAGVGNANAKHDDTFVYRLPYSTGKSYKVSQSFGGNFSHQKGVHYCVDFSMPEGAPIVAARGGKVVGVKFDSNVGGNDTNYKKLANYVYIQHADKTLGVYLHLMPNGVTVQPGQVVRTGQLIGKAGNTGYSDGPHLHFGVHSVFRDDELGRSFPIQFDTTSGVVKKLTQGKSYEAK